MPSCRSSEYAASLSRESMQEDDPVAAGVDVFLGFDRH
jgi:hypothetical protein